MTVPDTAKQPQDHLKPAVQRDAEQSSEPVTVEWHGIPVELPATVEDWDLEALEAFEQGKVLSAVRLLLGSRRYDELRAGVREKLGRKPTVRDLTPLAEEIARTYGFETAGG